MSESLPSSIGPFSITRILGRGGMGVVYEGVDNNGQRAAIKTILAHYASEPSIRKRFEAEIDALMRLNHPNIVRILGYGSSDNGDLFYAMEMVDGMDLEHAVPRGRTILWMAAIKLILEICKGLKIAHDRGIIHRDLKPANVLCTADGKVRLTDFGIARIFGSENETVAGSVLGTAEYMSPEQAASEKVDARADIYAVGGILYRLVAGRPPLIGRNVTELLQKQREIMPDPLSTYTLALPPELDQLVNDLLEKNPAKRPPNMTALIRRFQNILEDYEQTDFPPFHLGELGPSPLMTSSEPSTPSVPSSVPSSPQPLDQQSHTNADSTAIPQSPSQSSPRAGRPVNLYSGIPEHATQYGTIAAENSENMVDNQNFTYDTNVDNAPKRENSTGSGGSFDDDAIVSETLPSIASETPIGRNNHSSIEENPPSKGLDEGSFVWTIGANSSADDLYELAGAESEPDSSTQDSTTQTGGNKTVWMGNLDSPTCGFELPNGKNATSSSSAMPSQASEWNTNATNGENVPIQRNIPTPSDFHSSKKGQTFQEETSFQDAATACETGETRYATQNETSEQLAVSKRQYKIVREEDRDRLTLTEETAETTPVWRMPQTWILLGVLVVILGGFIWFFQPITADQLAKQIDTLLQTPTESGTNPEAEQPIRDFLTRFPDDARADMMREQLRAIELFQLERRLEWRTRTTAMRGVAHGEKAMTPLEHEYLQAVALAKENPVKGVKRFDALMTLYAAFDGAKDTNGQCYELLKRQRDQYETSIQSQMEFEQAEMERLFEPLPELVKTDAAAVAKQFAAIVELYGNRPWAKEHIVEMRKRLQETKKAVDAEANRKTPQNTDIENTDAENTNIENNVENNVGNTDDTTTDTATTNLTQSVSESDSQNETPNVNETP